MPAISIVIPIYKVEKYLRRCLDSVLNQTFTDWQAICVDDGSPDRSGKIAEEYAKKDQRFVVIHKENSGVSDARNIGVSCADGDYILFLDSDDFIHPQTLELLYTLALKNDADMVVFRFNKRARMQMKRLLQNGGDITSFLPDDYNRLYNLNKIKYRLTENILSKSTERKTFVDNFMVEKCYPVLKMVRRTIVAKHKFIKSIIIEDFPWWSEIMLDYPRTVITKAPFYFYVPNSSSILGSSKSLFMIQSICKGLKHINKYIISKKISEKDKRIYEREFLWPFIITSMRLVRNLDTQKDINIVKNNFLQMYKLGIFNNPQTMRARKYKRRIEKFISLIS